MTNYQRAVKIYEKGGQYAVYRAVDSGKLTAERWARCIPCEDSTPQDDGCCLVCGTKEES